MKQITKNILFIVSIVITAILCLAASFCLGIAFSYANTAIDYIAPTIFAVSLLLVSAMAVHTYWEAWKYIVRPSIRWNAAVDDKLKSIIDKATNKE